jgi:hypothetical protein
MESDQVSKESIEFVFRRAIDLKHFTERNMRRLLRLVLFIHRLRKDHKEHGPERKHGKMKVKDLIRKDEGATYVDVSKTELRDFQKVAKKYGVDFAIVKHNDQNPPVCSVFFKARDQDAISDVIRYYSEKKLMKEHKPSVLEKIKHLKDKVANMPKKVLHRAKERMR